MQKKIIALAVAGLMSGAAFAQSNVTVYGEVDLGYLRGSSDVTSGLGDTSSGIQSGVWAASRLGFKGEEALGNGMKAVFTLEYGLTADVNSGVGSGTTGAGNAREQTLGLSGDFGLVKAGRMTSLGHIAMNKFDPMRATAFAPLSSFRALSISNSSRVDNTVVYVSPVMSGFTVAATYGFGGTPGASNDTTAYGANTGAALEDQQRIIGFMADYTMGPLAIAYVHHRVNDLAVVAADGGTLANASAVNNRENLLAASYDLGMAKLFVSTQTDRNNNATATKVDRRITSVGAQVPVAANARVDIAYARLNDRFENVVGQDQDGRSWGVQYSYDLSKRTMAFAGYQRASSEDGAAFVALQGNGVAPSYDAGQSSVRSSGYGFGLRHKF